MSFSTGAGGNGNGHGNGIGLGDGIASQLLAYQANKPILDRLLKEAGFVGADPLKALLGGIENPAASPVTAKFGDTVPAPTESPKKK